MSRFRYTEIYIKGGQVKLEPLENPLLYGILDGNRPLLKVGYASLVIKSLNNISTVSITSKDVRLDAINGALTL